MFKYVNLLCFFVIISVNAYSQKRNCCGHFPFDYSQSGIIYIDSIIVNGVTVYTDSIVIERVVVYTDSMIVNGSVVYTDSSVSQRVTNYPITLTNKSPFNKAVFRDYCEFRNLMLLHIHFRLWCQQVSKLSDGKKGYYILSSDDRYINYAFISETDDKFSEYDPMDDGFSFSQKRYCYLMDWVEQEIDKGLMVSIGVKSIKNIKSKRTYIAKSFNF